MSEEQAKQWIKAFGITDRSVEEIWAEWHSEDLKLFAVTNTSSHTQMFLAEEPKLALVLAIKAGLLRKAANGRVRQLGEKFFASNKAFGSAVSRAMREGRPGLVERDGDEAIVNRERFKPLYPV